MLLHAPSLFFLTGRKTFRLVVCRVPAHSLHDMNKQGLALDKVVLLGRTFAEYARFFALDVPALNGCRVLDVASGVSSFCAEANARGIHATAFDRIYDFSADEIQARCEPDLEMVTRDIAKARTYNWEFYGSPDGMRAYRQRAYQTFLADYRMHGAARYATGSLPRLPFADGQFDLTLTSYLLFVYEEQFDYAFHQQSLLEMMRVTRGEARCYPIVTFEAKRSSYLERLRDDPVLGHLRFDEVETDFEFLIGSNRYLRVRHR